MTTPSRLRSGVERRPAQVRERSTGVAVRPSRRPGTARRAS